MLVGRAAELGALRRLARSAAAGAGGTALVEGLAGVGKTTLLRALVGEVDGLAVLWGRAPDEGGVPPWWPWREVAAAAGWSVRWTDHADPWSLWAEVAHLAWEAAARQPLLVLLDDLHATDDDTMRMTAYLARTLSDAPVALVVGTRPDERLGGLARAAAAIITLGPLTPEAADRVIDQHAPVDIDAARRREIHAIAEGNPLVLRELARSAAGTGMPREVRDAVEQRLAPADTATRRLAEFASVLGRAFDTETLARLAGTDTEEVLAGLDRLRILGVVEGRAAGWAFTHQVVRDVVYAALPEPQRLAAHRDAAAALAGPGSEAQVAGHLLAGVPLVAATDAIAAARAAADAAGRVGANAERAALLERVVPFLGPGGEATDVLLELGAAHLAAGATAAGVDAYRRAGDLASAAGDEHRHAQAVLGRAQRVLTGSGDPELVVALGVAAEAAARAGDDELVIRLRARRAQLRADAGEMEAARREAREAAAIARSVGRPAVLAIALNALHVSCWGAGGEEEAAATGPELTQVAAVSGDADLMLEAAVAGMVDGLRAGDLAAVDSALDQAAAVAERSGSPRHVFFVLSRRAMRAIVAGRLAEARRLLDRALAIGERIGEPDAIQVYWGARFLVLAETAAPDELLAMADGLAAMDEPRLLPVQANLRLAAGEPDRARALLASYLDAVDVVADVAADPTWGVLATQVAVGTGDRDHSAAVEGALAPHRGRLVVNAGAVTFCGLVDHWLGLLRAVQGRVEAADADLAYAADRYRAIGAVHLERQARTARDLLAPAGRSAAVALTRRAVLRRVDAAWEAGWEGATRRLPDSRGLHHLHALVGASGREIHAADLVTPGAAAAVSQQAREALLDADAKEAYRRRIRRLQAEEAAADDAGDVERSIRAHTELTALLDELRRAVGLGGRDRQPANDAERARIAVRKAISTTLTRLAEHDPSFAAHLRTSVRTGLRCAYVPDPAAAVRWTLS